MNQAGYSGSPLLKKLGVKAGFTLYLLHPPDNYFGLLGDLPENVSLTNNPSGENSILFIFLPTRLRNWKAIYYLAKIN